MTRWTEKLGFVVAPCLDGTFGMMRNCAATCALKVFFLGPTLQQKLIHKGQDNDTCDNNSEDSFR